VEIGALRRRAACSRSAISDISDSILLPWNWLLLGANRVCYSGILAGAAGSPQQILSLIAAKSETAAIDAMSSYAAKGNEMINAKPLSWRKVHLVFLVGALLSVSLATKSQARSTEAQAKPTRLSVSTQAALEEGQKGLQRQVESLTGMTQSRADHMQQLIDSLTRQLNGLASTQQEIKAGQQLLTSTSRSMLLLSTIIVALLLVLCGVLFFLAYRLEQFGGSVFKDSKVWSRTGADLQVGHRPRVYD